MRVVRANVNTIIVDRTNTDLNAIITSIGSEVSTLYIYEAVSLSAHLTIPSTCSVVIDGNGSINLITWILIINGTFRAHPIQRIFLYTTGYVLFGVTGAAPEISPCWFGMIGDNDSSRAAANYTAFNQALTSAYITQIGTGAGVDLYKISPKIKIPTGIYYINDTVVMNRYGITIEGYGAAFRYTKTSGACLDYGSIFDTNLMGLTIILHTDAATVYGIKMVGRRNNFRDVAILGNTAAMTLNVGIRIEGSSGTSGVMNKFENVYANCGTSISILNTVGAGPSASPNYFSKIVDASYEGVILRGASCNKFEDLNSQTTKAGGYSVQLLKNGADLSNGNDIGYSRMVKNISIESGCLYNRIFKQDVTTIGPVVLPQSPDNYFESLDTDYPVNSAKIATFASGDTSPSVRGKKVCKTANVAPTTITTFDDSVEGQSLRVIFTDAITTIDFTGTNLKGNAGVDWTPNAGDMMICVYDGTNWYCNPVDCTA